MKHLFPVLLALLLLTGCAPQTREPADIAPPSSGITEPEPTAESLPEPVTLVADTLTGYPMEGTVTGFFPMGEGLLVLTEKNSLTTLTLVDPDTMEVLYRYDTGFLLTPHNFTLRLTDRGLSYFNGPARETLQLDHHLREIRRLKAPEGLVGAPMLSGDGSTLFYCTAAAVRALDTDTGISRILKEAAYPVQGVSGLLLEDSVVQVSITDESNQLRTLFLSRETGQLLADHSGNLNPQTSGDLYFLNHGDAGIQTILYGSLSGDTMVLEPRGAGMGCTFLPLTQGAVTADWAEGSIRLELYDLTSGKRLSELSVPPELYPMNLVQTKDGSLWFLSAQAKTGKSMLCRWDVRATAVADDRLYCRSHFTKDNPDYEGLAACSLYAAQLSEAYGIEILIYKDAAAVEPWDYHLEYEYQSTILMQELQSLERRLANFPRELLDTLADTFTSLKIALVRSAVGSPESGSLEAVNGIQFFDNYDAYIVLSTGHDTEYALYHELSHLMETVVLTRSTAYDRWDKLNPSGFKYDNDYTANQGRDGSKWLQPGKEYFIDTYSMSYPKEDRARLLEYAMTEGHEDLFSSPNLQAKLRQLCTGIREAFDLSDDQGPFLWEQYLQ